jgi:hypothetical protein
MPTKPKVTPPKTPPVVEAVPAVVVPEPDWFDGIRLIGRAFFGDPFDGPTTPTPAVPEVTDNEGQATPAVAPNVTIKNFFTPSGAAPKRKPKPGTVTPPATTAPGTTPGEPDEST